MSIHDVFQAGGRLLSQAEVKVGAALIGGVLGYIFHTAAVADMALVALIMVILDMISGMVAAWQTGEAISSRRASRSIAKLLAYSCGVAGVSLAFKVIPGIGEARVVAITAVLGLVILTELISVMENMDKLGLKVIPSWVKNIVRDAASRTRKNEPSP